MNKRVPWFSFMHCGVKISLQHEHCVCGNAVKNMFLLHTVAVSTD